MSRILLHNVAPVSLIVHLKVQLEMPESCLWGSPIQIRSVVVGKLSGDAGPPHRRCRDDDVTNLHAEPEY